MIEQILDWELAIVDITTLNPNVFYELGIRHTARSSGTVIIRNADGGVPFNINGMRVVTYSLKEEEIDASRRALQDAIVAALTLRSNDSLVHQLIPSLNLSRKANALQHREADLYTLPAKPGTSHHRLQFKRIGMITGDLVYVDDVDIWVNPENTRMEMARIHDDSVSATIRYYGGRRDQRGVLESDLVGDELRSKVGKHAIVEATSVIVTQPHKLKQPNRVRRIFHLAAQHGEPGKGYVTVRSIEDCVKSALEKADEINSTWKLPISLRLMRPLQSIIFPLFGTRGRGLDPHIVTSAIVGSAISYLRSWPDTKMDRIFFLAYTDRDRELCETAFKRLDLAKANEECRGG